MPHHVAGSGEERGEESFELFAKRRRCLQTRKERKVRRAGGPACAPSFVSAQKSRSFEIIRAWSYASATNDGATTSVARRRAVFGDGAVGVQFTRKQPLLNPFVRGKTLLH